MVLEAPVVAAPEAPEGDLDTDLVAAVRRGDDRAFEQLYTRYQRRISAYVFGMVKDHGRAEDITQEVFISALRRMRETDRAIAFKPWIYEIAKNACIDQFRRSRRAEEVSFDAGEGLAGADHGRLVASEPSPDAAVDAKQQLEQLCGAFGGLSDSHHEILVLREFEGLSYREIGDRMGLSRPGVESTLFRARKRLTEEYDELVSGQRCVRIQSIIASAESSAMGARDTRRLARHIAHCQPCRRQAVASGIDAAVMARKPARQRVIERVAGLLPIPAFLRGRGWYGGEQIVPVSEPMAAAWSKAVAVAATVIVAGVGAGVAPQRGDSDDQGSRPAREGQAGRGRQGLRRHPRSGPRAPARRRDAAQQRRHEAPRDDRLQRPYPGDRPQRRQERAAAEHAALERPGRQRRPGRDRPHAQGRGQPQHLGAQAVAGRDGAQHSRHHHPHRPAAAEGRRAGDPAARGDQPGRRPGRRDGGADHSGGQPDRRPGRGRGQRRDRRPAAARRLSPHGGRARERLASRPCLGRTRSWSP